MPLLTPAARAISSAVVVSKAVSNPRSFQISSAVRISLRRVSRERSCDEGRAARRCGAAFDGSSSDRRSTLRSLLASSHLALPEHVWRMRAPVLYSSLT